MSELQQEYQTIEYPPKKEVWGPAYWVYIHTFASQYPENPNRSDRLEAKEHIRKWSESIPCDDPCRIHAREFIRTDPPALDSRKSLLEWTCALHNSVNEKLGKPIARCILSGTYSPGCPSCRPIPSGEKPGIWNAAAAADIQGSMKMFKEGCMEIIKELSKRHNEKPPEVRFAACPLHPDTSCIEWKKEDLDDKGLLKGPAVIYINPYAASFKTPVHEFQHYLDLRKGRGHSLSEYEANRFAYEIIAKYFPHDTIVKRENAVSASAAAESERIDPLKIPLGYEYSNFKNWQERFPAYKSVLERSIKKEEPEQPPSQQQIESQEEGGGIVSYLDSIYQMPAEWFGIRAHELNMAYTPEIIVNSISLLARSNLSSIGSALFGFVASLSLILTGVFAKQGLTHGDRLLLQNMSASFLMNTLTYANPKVSDGIILDGRYLISQIMSGQFGFHTIKNALWETPEMYGAKEHERHTQMESYAGETVRAQQQASQRSYDASRPSGGVSLTQGPFGRSQRAIGRNPRKLYQTPSPMVQSMHVGADHMNFSNLREPASSAGAATAGSSDDFDIDVSMNPDTFGVDDFGE